LVGDNRGSVPLLILDLGFDVINSIGGLHLKGDGLSSEGLYEDLHDDVWEWVRLRVNWGRRYKVVYLYCGGVCK
jgi:hypothetical protein